MTSKALVPIPGTDLVPDGWCESVIVPWLAEQTETEDLATASAQLAGLEAAYRTLGSDTLELVKARRHLEIRWGELLGPGKPGPQSSLAGEDSLDKDERYKFRQLADAKLQLVDLIRAATDSDDLSRVALLRAAMGLPAPHVTHNAGDNEWYTPANYIESARLVMGSIDLDPASTPEANEVVGAKIFWTVDDDGLKRPWAANVWMNPPYEAALIGRFCARLASFYKSGEVTQACVLVNNATETAWFATLAERASAMCFPKGRVKFWHTDTEKGSTPLQGQAVVYMGANYGTFREEFSRFGFTVQL